MSATVSPLPFVERFREADTPFLSPARVGEFFGFRVQELADNARVHRYTPTSRPHAVQLQRDLLDTIRALSAATETTGNPERAAFLLRNEPLRAFGHKTADALVPEGRVEDVVADLESLAAGAAG